MASAERLRIPARRVQQFAKLRSESCFFPRAVETAAARKRDYGVLKNADLYAVDTGLIRGCPRFARLYGDCYDWAIETWFLVIRVRLQRPKGAT
jgi:hypothetical protein